MGREGGRRETEKVHQEQELCRAWRVVLAPALQEEPRRRDVPSTGGLRPLLLQSGCTLASASCGHGGRKKTHQAGQSCTALLRHTVFTGLIKTSDFVK